MSLLHSDRKESVEQAFKSFSKAEPPLPLAELNTLLVTGIVTGFCKRAASFGGGC